MKRTSAAVVVDERWRTVLDGLTAEGDLSPSLREVFERVDRAEFVPDVIGDYGPGERYYQVDRRESPRRWADLVSSNTPVITQLDEQRRPSSSSSMPSIMALMLAALDPQRGDQVLELGAGTGYNAALLAETVGRAGRVLTVDIDPGIADAASRNLQAAGYHRVGVSACDGSEQRLGTWDRIIATYAVDRLPRAWLRSLRPGGILVAPWRNGLLEQAVIRIEATDDGIGPGRDGIGVGSFVDGASFMTDRGAWRGTKSPPPPGTGETSLTGIGPAYLEAVPISMWLARDLPGVLLYRADRGLFLHDEGSDSYAVLDLATEQDGQWEVRQTGPRRIWDELRASLDHWFDADQPGLGAWRIVVESGGEVELVFVGEDRPAPAETDTAAAPGVR